MEIIVFGIGYFLDFAAFHKRRVIDNMPGAVQQRRIAE